MPKISKFLYKNSKFFICIFAENAPLNLHDLGKNMEIFKKAIFALQIGIFQKFSAQTPTYPHSYPQKQVFVWITRPLCHPMPLLCICVEIYRFSSNFVLNFTRFFPRISFMDFCGKFAFGSNSGDTMDYAYFMSFRPFLMSFRAKRSVVEKSPSA